MCWFFFSHNLRSVLYSFSKRKANLKDIFSLSCQRIKINQITKICTFCLFLTHLYDKKKILSTSLRMFQSYAALDHKPLLNTSHTLGQNFLKNLLKNKEMVFENGLKMYKPRLIMARVRYLYCVTFLSSKIVGSANRQF